MGEFQTVAQSWQKVKDSELGFEMTYTPYLVKKPVLMSSTDKVTWFKISWSE